MTNKQINLSNLLPAIQDHEPRAISVTGDGEKDHMFSYMVDFVKSMPEPSKQDMSNMDEIESAFNGVNAIVPLYDKEMLCRVSDCSSALSDAISVYSKVIGGYGHKFESVLDVDESEFVQKVKDSILFERYNSTESGSSFSEPTEEEIIVKIDDIKRAVTFDRMIAGRFFENCARNVGGKKIAMNKLRQLLIKDKETVGEAYLEVLRESTMDSSRKENIADNSDGSIEVGHIKRLMYTPSISIRKFSFEKEAIEVTCAEKIHDFKYDIESDWRHFRKYVQIDRTNKVLKYFKEFGDPRIMSSLTGDIYVSLKDYLADGHIEEDIANELICIEHEHSLNSYGVARWISNTKAVVGNSKAEEVNLDYFDNKAIPPHIFLIQGGRLAKNAAENIRGHLNSLKGTGNFHKVLILEAMPFNSGLPGQVPHKTQIEVKSLIDKQQQDALFLKYLEYNDKKIASNFRIPGILLGKSEEYTRATAKEALRFFEEMVAQPERQEFDDFINAEIMPELGVRYVKFKSKSADTSDLDKIIEVIKVATKNGVVSPYEMRNEVGKIIGRELGNINEEWNKKPLDISLAEIGSEARRIIADARGDKTTDLLPPAKDKTTEELVELDGQEE